MKDRILITRTDYERLQALIREWQDIASRDAESLEALEQELERAEIIEPGETPPNLVVMNSEVRLMDLDSGDVRVYRLVFPTQQRRDNAISVLAPIGTAVLGYQAGDVIEWRVPRGIRRLKVLDVRRRREAA